MQVRKLIKGRTPLVISIPHMGTFLPADIKSRMTLLGQSMPDTDWHLDRLYDFAVEMGASILMSSHSRYVIDLNRPVDDETLYPGQVKTGLVPLQSFAGEDLYLPDEEPDEAEKVNRIASYWMPYHETLDAEIARIRAEFGYALLYDAHSIKSEVPRLFDGVLPDLNIGTVKGKSCAGCLESAIMAVAEGQDFYSSIFNGRFIGGYITRSYGNPDNHIHAVQMELACRNYMNERTFAYEPGKAAKLQAVLKDILGAMLEWGRVAYPSSPNQK